MKINIHAGHGTSNSKSQGAVGLINESDENRKVKDEVIRLLKAEGHTVYDTTVDYPTSPQDCLSKIVTNCNKNLVDIAYNEIIQVIKVFEKSNNVRIYHIVKVETDNSIVIYLLYVKRNKREWKNEREDLRNGFTEVYFYEVLKKVKNIGIETESGQVVKVV